MLRALIWDVDGTLAETEHDGHRVAFNRCFEEMRLPWRWDETRYAELLHVTGGTERLLADMGDRPDAPASPADRHALARAIHQRKNAVYGELLAAGAIQPRPGVLRLLAEAAQAGLRQGIATTTSRVNVEGLCRQMLGPDWRDVFSVVVCGEDVSAKKPDPQAYVRALEGLDVEAIEALAVEDSPPGLAAAMAAGIPTVVARSRYFSGFEAPGAAHVCATLEGVDLQRLASVHDAHRRSRGAHRAR